MTEGVALVDQVGTALNEIVASVKSSADIVANIARASVEQSAALEQINKTLMQMGAVNERDGDDFADEAMAA